MESDGQSEKSPFLGVSVGKFSVFSDQVEVIPDLVLSHSYELSVGPETMYQIVK